MKYSWQKMQAPFLLPSIVDALIFRLIHTSSCCARQVQKREKRENKNLPKGVQNLAGKKLINKFEKIARRHVFCLFYVVHQHPALLIILLLIILS